MNLTPDIQLNNGNPVIYQQDAELFADISGTDGMNRPRARVLMMYYTQYSDGTQVEHDTLITEKPILSVFKHAGYVNVRMDFHQMIDQDLQDFWTMLDRYSDPMNSVSYSPEELESGFYKGADGSDLLVYFPTIALTISPVNKEKAYGMTGINPAFYTLHPQKPGGPVCVLELVFKDDLFGITRDLPLDLAEIQHEALQELGIDPTEQF